VPRDLFLYRHRRRLRSHLKEIPKLSGSDTIIDIHKETVLLSTPELVRQLISHLGPTLVATLADVKDPKLPHKWAKADGPTPRDQTLIKLQMAHRIWRLISSSDSDSVARAWFVGSNPRLDEESPIFVIRSGRGSEAHKAAVAFVKGLDE
jgi:hypothetical protein